MQRTFTSVDLVELPRMDALTVIALASTIIAAAEKVIKEGPLPGPLPDKAAKSLARITSRIPILQQAIEKQGAKLPLTVKEIDHTVDVIVRAICEIVQAWARIAPFLPQGADAQKVADRIFGDGLKFLSFAAVKQWGIVDAKLKAIDAEGLTPIFQNLGALPLLQLAQEKNKLYGDVIGTTQAPEESPEVGAARMALIEEIRVYVIRVVASVDVEEDPQTQARADALLRPVMEWQSPKPSSSGKAQDAAETSPTPSPGNDPNPPTP